MSEVNPLFVLEAEQFMLAELYDDAIELCKAGLAEYPEYISAWAVLAKAYKNQGDMQSAIKTVEESVNLFPDNKLLNKLVLEINESVKDTESIGTSDEISIEPVEEEVHIPEIESVFQAEEIVETNSENVLDESIEESISDEVIMVDATLIVSENESEDDIVISVPIEEEDDEIVTEQTEAESEIVEITDEFSDIVDDGDIIEQADEASSLVDESKIVTEQTEAESEIVEITDEFSDIVDDGDIIEQADEATSKVDDDDTIVLEEEIDENIEPKQQEFSSESGFLSSFISNSETETRVSNINAVYGLDSVLHKSLNIDSFDRKSFRDLVIPDIVDIKEIEFTKDAEIKEPEIQIHGNDSFPVPFESKLADLAKKLEEVSIPRVPEEDEEILNGIENSKLSIVSETMANIYLQQGAYEEAAKAYKELLIQNPDKKDYFISKLNTLITKIK